jgi:hypothetical protein
MFCGIDNHGGKNDLADVGGEGRALCRSFGGVDQEVVGPSSLVDAAAFFA